MVRFWMLVLGLLTGFALSDCSIAQVVPDQTLPVGERSQVSGAPNLQIGGGTTRGTNLFHSFQQFSIPTGSSASFNNAPNLTNIITRVTGNNPSNINGLIRANGTANLFLINPNGILFGANARLEIGGSFLASSANSLKFADESEFSAKAPQSSPLLTISAPTGLHYGSNPGTITVQGKGHNLSYASRTFRTIRGDVEALQVQPGKTLALVGGNIILEGGNLRAEAGRIELGSVALGNVSINNVSINGNDSGLSLGYADVKNFGNILLSQKASIDASGEGGGSIQVQSGHLSVKDGSAILSITTGAKPGGDFTVNATELVELLGESADQRYASAILTESQGAGSSGDLAINTKKLLATDGAYASTLITSSGKGGSLTVKASDSIELVGSGIFASGFYTGTSPGSSGNSGALSITTNFLEAANGAVISASTFGEGNAGSVTIHAADLVRLDGLSSTGFVSGAYSLVVPDAQGNAGGITIDTRALEVVNGGVISVSTFGKGNAGSVVVHATDSIKFDGRDSSKFGSGVYSQVNSDATGNAGGISITTDLLRVFNGARISTATRGRGNAGSVTINVNTYESSTGGQVVSRTSNQFSAGNIILNVKDNITLSGLNTGIFANATDGSTGKGGSIIIDPRTLVIRDGAAIAADSQGTGIGGDIHLDAGSLILNNGIISARTRSNTGGNIALNLKDLLILRNSSQISTTAGNQEFGGDGGNITLDSKFIVTVPQENSTISANAFSGRGGNIRIATQGLFGIEPRASTTTGLSSITASSEFGISGTITLNTPDVDPSRGLVQLSTDLQDASGLIASTCLADQGNSFAITGRGGLPEDPRQPLMGSGVWLDDRATGQSQSAKPDPRTIPTIVEAQGWIKNPDGTIALVAAHLSGIAQPFLPFSCH